MTGPACSYWLEQTESDVPVGNQWLSAGERSHLSGLLFAKRREDWRLGRWTAKRAVASCLNLPIDSGSLEDVEIRALPSGAPAVFLSERPANVNMSLSHRSGRAFCVVALTGSSVGCDLEVVEPREYSFVTDFFTANEQQLVERASPDQRPLLVTLVWSAKESALKVLKVGLRLDTAFLDVSCIESTSAHGQVARQDDAAIWSPLSVRSRSGQIFRGWWRCVNDMVRTVVFST